MKKTILISLTIVIVISLSWSAQAQYDLRQYPSAGRGVVIMGADLPPSWYLDVWINPVIINGQPQGPPSITFIPHPTGQQRVQEYEVGNEVGAVTAFAVAWELDRSNNHILKGMKFQIVRYIGQVPDYYGYYWAMYIGLYELGVRWPFGSYY